MTLATLLVLICSVVTFVTAYPDDLAYNPGMSGSLNTIAIENHKTIISNFIIEKLNGVHLPNITFGSEDGMHGSVNVNTYLISYVTEDQVTLTFHEEDNAITFTLSNCMAKFHSNELYAKEKFIHTTG